MVRDNIHNFLQFDDSFATMLQMYSPKFVNEKP